MGALAASFAAGILAAAYLSVIGWLAVGASVACLACALWRERGRAAAGVLGAVYLLGATSYVVRLQVPNDDTSRISRYATDFCGTIAEDPDIRGDKLRLLVKATSAGVKGKRVPVSGLVMTTVYLQDDSPLEIGYGDRVKIEARPYQPFPPTNPGQFSWKDYLERQGIHSCATVRERSDIQRLPGRASNVVIGAALSAKHHLAASIERIHSPQQASVIIGMVLGTYAYLPSQTFDNFSRTGTLHLLAASGFNCFILALLATTVLRLLRCPPKAISIIVAIILLFYLMMVGAKPSLVRATIMAGLWLLAVPLQRVPNVKNLFFTAALVTLAIRPTDLFDVGFQLSFAAVWALVTSGDIIELTLQRLAIISPNPPRKRRNRLSRCILWIRRETVQAAVATITVTLFTTPIVAYHFNYISLVSLPANIALAMGVYVVFAVGLLSPVVASIPCIGEVLGFVGSRVTDAMLSVVNYLGSGTYSAITVPSPGPLAIVGYYLLLYVAIDYLRSLSDER